jgi:SagB-type dehydrogenase family enzyme
MPYADGFFKEFPQAESSPLPPARILAMSLGEAVTGRLSCRHFAQASVQLDELGTVLKAAYGVQGKVQMGALEHLERPVPSGGGLYPLEIYVLARWLEGCQAGVYHYVPLNHSLERLRIVALHDSVVSQLFLGQPYLAGAAAIVILAALIERTTHKYADRGYRYVLLEAGHVGQNINLAAVALGLGSFNLGGFFDRPLAEVCGLDADREVVVYAVALGRPALTDRAAVRLAADVS